MKNILLMFLSDGERPESEYKIGDNKIVKTRHSNESAVYELAQTCKIDMIFAFASKRVMKSRDIDGKEQNTLDYFKQRVAGIVAPENIVICPYDENMNTALTDVGAMAEMILKEKEKYAAEEYTLHADMTGGMRNASMMMLGVMRLLEYSQIKMGRVLYSYWERGRVEDSADVYRFFDLVAGAKEFVNYGSVIELNSYFDKEKETSAELKGLLDAMRNFSESIKLCQYGEFKKAIRDLGENIKLFSQKLDAQSDANDRLFSTMLPIIQRSYGPLLASDNDLEIIEWCVKRGYLQQAMTLYTERVPEFIFDKGLLAVSDQAEAKIEDDYNKFLKDRRGTRSYFILAAYGQTPEDDKKKNIKKDFLDALKKSFQNRKLDSAMVKQDLDDFVNQEEIRKDYEILWSHEACEKLLKLMQDWKATLGNVDKELADQIQANPLFKEFLKGRGETPELSFDKNTFYYAFVQYILNNASPDVLEKTFAIKLNFTDEYMAKVPRIAMKRNLDKNVFVCAKGIEASLLDAIDDYKWVRDIRNSSNHARNDKDYEPSDVTDRIRQACERLKEMEKVVNAAVE